MPQIVHELPLILIHADFIRHRGLRKREARTVAPLRAVREIDPQRAIFANKILDL